MESTNVTWHILSFNLMLVYGSCMRSEGLKWNVYFFGILYLVLTLFNWHIVGPTSQLLVCCVILKIEGCVTFIPPHVVGQQLTLVGCTMLWTLIKMTCELLGLDDWELNKLRTRLWLEENPISFKISTFFWNKLVSF
jgi:hypothetical protein